MDRRQLLRTSSLGPLSLIASRTVPTALGQSRTVGANDRIRVGIVGFSDRLVASLLPSFKAYAEEFNCEIAENKDRTYPGLMGDDFRPYLRVLRESGYQGAVSIEGKGTEEQLTPAFAQIARQASEISFR